MKDIVNNLVLNSDDIKKKADVTGDGKIDSEDVKVSFTSWFEEEGSFRHQDFLICMFSAAVLIQALISVVASFSPAHLYIIPHIFDI